MSRRIAVIGAGVAGLVTAKCLREAGLVPVVLERRARLGGVWRLDETADDGGGPAYRSLRANVSRHTMGLSDFPMPSTLDDFPTREQVLRYLEDYAAEFGLGPDLCFECAVESVAPDGDGWRVTWQRAGKTTTERFAGIVICSGRHQTPFEPDIRGAADFGGRWMHSHAYVDASPFTGERVLVVGTGSSGVDLALEIAHVAARTYLSSERGAWFVPKRLDSGRPADHVVNRLSALAPSALRNRVFRRLVTQAYRARGLDLGQLSLPVPEFDMQRARITPSDGIVEALAQGRVLGMPGLQRAEPDAVVFKDGRRVQLDSVVLATGYRAEYPFLPPGLLEHVGRTPRLYHHVFPARHPGLAFVGTPWVIGPYPPVFELQARWIARVLSGGCSLPTAAAMTASIDAAVAAAQRSGVRYDREQFVDYMDLLASEIGCRPQPWRHPGLFKELLVGPLVSAQYRLDGPGRCPRAAAMIRKGQRQ